MLLLLFQEGPHSVIKEDEFFDAIDASLDKLEKEEEDVRICTRGVFMLHNLMCTSFLFAQKSRTLLLCMFILSRIL